MNKTAIVEQADEFKAKYGEYPKYPIRIRYKWMSTRAEGDLNGPSIFGFPGVVGATDSEVTELVMLYDGDKRHFPKYEEEISAKKKREEVILAQEPLAVLSKEDCDSLVKLYKEAQTTPAIWGQGFDMAGSAWNRVREKQKQLGKKYGFDSDKAVINGKTGKVYRI